MKDETDSVLTEKNRETGKKGKMHKTSLTSDASSPPHEEVKGKRKHK